MSDNFILKIAILKPGKHTKSQMIAFLAISFEMLKYYGFRFCFYQSIGFIPEI